MTGSVLMTGSLMMTTFRNSLSHTVGLIGFQRFGSVGLPPVTQADTGNAPCSTRKSTVSYTSVMIFVQATIRMSLNCALDTVVVMACQ